LLKSDGRCGRLRVLSLLLVLLLVLLLLRESECLCRLLRGPLCGELRVDRGWILYCLYC
jgi:hypothetical protein